MHIPHSRDASIFHSIGTSRLCGFLWGSSFLWRMNRVRRRQWLFLVSSRRIVLVFTVSALPRCVQMKPPKRTAMVLFFTHSRFKGQWTSLALGTIASLQHYVSAMLKWHLCWRSCLFLLFPALFWHGRRASRVDDRLSKYHARVIAFYCTTVCPRLQYEYIYSVHYHCSS